ncbi:hypothetical protein [Pedobacter glucosidilyticus]|uniref:hypothetical protein n=1 Tax=Pedobacter glucosidilyticus TaxID=1122941 RepID=UPI001B7FB093|nr:hypothetical protein [Pedobacter glucosidilyticus]
MKGTQSVEDSNENTLKSTKKNLLSVDAKISNPDTLISVYNKDVKVLPFGCEMFEKTNFPIEWEITPPFDDSAQTKFQKSMNDIIDCFLKLNRIHKNYQLPEIKNYEYIPLNNRTENELQKSTHYSYRLPKMGNYEVFYLSYPINRPKNYGESDQFFLQVGNLLFYNKQTKDVKIITVFFWEEAYFFNWFRLFNINLDGSIRVTDFAFSEEDTKKTNDVLIKIKDNDIKITKLKLINNK